MQHAVDHLSLALASLVLVSACSTDECEQNPDSIFCADSVGDETGETGNPEEIYGPCGPFAPGDYGEAYECKGQGNGWLELTVYPIGEQPVECVNWPDGGAPTDPTVEDCVPLDLADLPDGVLTPGACCGEDAMPLEIITQCEEDCGYATCVLAIQKLRDAAMSLPVDGPKGVVRGDLLGMAALLETPVYLMVCAEEVDGANGEMVPIDLGPGMSSDLEFGHVSSAILNLQCALDEESPYAIIPDAEACYAPPNIPQIEEEANLGGEAALGAVTMFGPEGNANTSLYDVMFAFSEQHNRDGSVSFILKSFEANAVTTAVGAYVMSDPRLKLAAPASARLVGDTVSFPAGSLRLTVSGGISIEGELLFGGNAVSGDYVNTDIATAVRTSDGRFSFVEAPFETEGYLFVLNTEEALALSR